MARTLAVTEITNTRPGHMQSGTTNRRQVVIPLARIDHVREARVTIWNCNMPQEIEATEIVKVNGDVVLTAQSLDVIQARMEAN